MKNDQSNNMYGIIAMLVHCLLYAVYISCAKIIGRNFSSFQIVFVQSFVALLLISICMPFFQKKEFIIVRKKLHFLRGFLICCESLIFIYSCTIVSATNIAALTLTYPLFTTIMAVIFLKEKIKARRIAGIIIGFLGALIVIRPGLNSFELGSVLMLCVLLLWGLIDVLTKIMNRTEPILGQMFYMTLICTIFYAPFAMFSWKMPVGFDEIAWLIGFGIIYTLYMLAIVLALKYSDISVLMPIYFSELIFVDLAAFILFHDVPDFWNIVGSSIIICSVLYIAHRERVVAKRLKAQAKLKI